MQAARNLLRAMNDSTHAGCPESIACHELFFTDQTQAACWHTGTSSTDDSTHAGRQSSGMRSRGSASSAGLGSEGRVRGGIPRSASIAARLAATGAASYRAQLSSSKCVLSSQCESQTCKENMLLQVCLIHPCQPVRAVERIQI